MLRNLLENFGNSGSLVKGPTSIPIFPTGLLKQLSDTEENVKTKNVDSSENIIATIYAIITE